jgi:hypothetical protein
VSNSSAFLVWRQFFSASSPRERHPRRGIRGGSQETGGRPKKCQKGHQNEKSGCSGHQNTLIFLALLFGATGFEAATATSRIQAKQGLIARQVNGPPSDATALFFLRVPTDLFPSLLASLMPLFALFLFLELLLSQLLLLLLNLLLLDLLLSLLILLHTHLLLTLLLLLLSHLLLLL